MQFVCGKCDAPMEEAVGPREVSATCPRCGNSVRVLTDSAPRIEWSAEAQERMERIPPFIRPMLKEEVEAYARENGYRVVTPEILEASRNRSKMEWTPEAEMRMENVPAPIRAMARLEIERMAAQKGYSKVTEEIMDEAKQRFLGTRGG